MNFKRLVQKHAYLLEVLGILVIMTILGVIFRDALGLVNLALLHLIPILLIAVSGNVRLTLVIAMLCIVIFNLLYIPPLYTFKIYDYAHIWSLFIFILVGYVIAIQAKNLRLKYQESQMREVLLDIVSHDLKTPLSSIYGSASLLVDEKKLPKETQENLYRDILQTSVGMKKLITNLLDNSRLKDGTAKPNLEWCDFNDIVGVAIEELSLEYNTDVIDIKITYPYL
ncbi:MAG: PAS domain-containing sensor histidine kinase, partial [Campylobacterales bacterium]|nr:PAS domain-containing sensor histidine kinase [Campylobacterales bacterium]